MAAIKGGAQLKKVAPISEKKSSGGGGVGIMKGGLVDSLLNRRAALEGSDSDDSDEDWGSDED